MEDSNNKNITQEQNSKKILFDSSLTSDNSSQNYKNKKILSKDVITKKVLFSKFQKKASLPRINPKLGRFPYCIVWTPIPLLTYINPSIGHSGIGTSKGIIHDFSGSFFVSVGHFTFGKPTKYFQLDLNEQEKFEFDRAIERSDHKYNSEEFNLCANNCHSHVA